MKIIVAIARGGAIGSRGDLLCHLSADLRHFKSVTMGHPVVMGRRTFLSLPGGPLPGRRNIVISRSGFTAPGAEVYPSLQEALEAASTSAAEPFVIGGGEVYAAALPMAAELYVTRIDAGFPEADTFFPELKDADWRLAEISEMFTSESGIPFRFEKYERRQ